MKGEIESDKNLKSSRVSEEIYKNIFEHSPIGIAIHQEWKVLFINPAMVQMLGYESVDEIAGRSILEFVHPDYREQAEKNVQMVLSRKGKSGELHEMKLIRKDGSPLDVTAVAQFIIYNGKPAIQAYLLNITERKRVQEALRETEEFSRAVIEHSPLGVSVRSYNGQLLSVNEVWKKIWAVPEAELIDDFRKKRSVLEFDETDTYLKEFLADVKRVYQRGGYLHIPEVEIENPRKGAARWVSQYFYAINDEKGKVDRVVILTEDITERKQVEERYRTFTEEALVGIYIYSNSKKKYLFVNPEMAKITGYSREELLEINPNRLAVPEDLSILAEREKKLLKGKPIDPEYVIRIRRNDGSIAVLSVRTHRILYAGEEVALGNCIDITERKRAESALKRRVKISGVLAALTSDLYTAESVQEVLDVAIKHLAEVFPFYVSVNLIEEKEGKRFLPVKAYHIESKILSFAEKLIGRKFMSWPIPLYQDSVISRTMSTGHPTVIGLDFEPDEPVVQTDVSTMLEAMLERKSPLRPVARLIAERTGEKSLLGIPFSNASGEIIGSLTVLADFRFSRDDYNLAKVASDMIGRALGQLLLTEELQESEERYRTLQDNVPVGIFRTTPEGNLLSANPVMLRMLGYTSMQEFKPISVEEVYVVSERRAEFRRVLEKKGSIADFEVQLRRKDGSFFWASLNASAIKDEAGDVIYYDGIVVDIAERKRGGELRQVRVQLLDMLREVETIEDCLQLACAAVRDARLFKRAVFTTKDKKGETTHFAQVGVDSQLVEELSKASPAAKETLEQMFRSEFKISHSYFIPVEAGVDIEQTGRYVLQEEESGKGPEAWQQGDELLVPMLGMGGLIKSWLSVDTPFDRKRPDRTTVIYLEDIVDIVARQIREIENVNALRESEERYRTFTEEALVGVYIYGEENRFLYVNPVMEEIFGYTQEELLSMNPWDMVLQEDMEGHLKARGEAQAKGEEVSPSYQMRIRRKNGETTILEIKAHEIVYQGSPATLGNCIDITERKRAEQALEREHRAFRIIVQAAVHGKDIADLCFQVLEGLAGALDFDAGTVRLYDANQNFLELTASFGLSETEQVAAAVSQPLNDTAYIAAFTAQTRKPIIAPDVTREQVLKPFASRLKKFGERSLISWPLLDAREELLGVLHLWSRKTIHISEDDKSFFERITVMFSSVLERKLAEEERDRGRRELQALFEGVDVLFWSIREEGGKLYYERVNSAFAAVEGLKPEHYNGKAITELHSAKECKGIENTFAWVKGGKSHDSEVYFNNKYFLMRFIPLSEPDGRIRRFLGTGVDITDRKRQEETIKVREDTIKNQLFYEESISFCFQVLAETVDLDTALQQVIDEIVSVAKTGRSFIFKNISPQAGKICVRQINQSVVEGVEPKLAGSSSDSSSCDDLSAELLGKLTAGRPYGGTLAQMSRQDMSALASVEEGSVLILPIKVEDTLWGLIGFEDATPERRWKQEDIQLLRTVGSMIGTTIERKRAEKELRESEERYRVFTEEALVGVYISHHGCYLFVNPAMEKITGYSKKELLEIHPYDLVLPDGQKTLLNRHDAANRGEEVSADYTIPIRRKDGEVAVLQIRTHPIVYEGKSAYLGNCVDITELIGQREQIEQAKQAWESTFDSISDLVMILDSEYNIMRANRAVAEYTGFDIKDVIGRSYLEVFNLEDVFTDSKGLPKTDSMLPEHFEINDYKRGRIFSVSASPLRDPLGKTVATVHVARDISQMRVMEKALASSEAQFRGLAESAQDMIFNIDLDGTIRYVNPAMQHTFGYDPSELVGGNLASILEVDQEASLMDKPLLEHLLSSDEGGRIPLFEIKTQDVNGRKHVLEVSARRLAQQIIGVVRDVSERKKMEQQLIHASKLASIGVLAAGIAHQVNNPLATMLATSSLLRSMLLGSEDVPAQLKEELSAYIDTMEEQVERTSRVVTGLLEFTQTKRSEVRPADVNSILTEALDLLSQHLSLRKLSVSIHTDLGADLPPALVDSTALQQVLVNVIQNSFEAMGVEGELDVRTENTDSGMVRITISDNGPGVPPDLRDEIFEPLFTTKTDRKGTGLGLAISVMLLERFRGRIYLDDASKEGATFVIEVPIQEEGTVEGENKEV